MKKLLLSLPLLLSVFIAQAKELKIWNGIFEYPTTFKIDLGNGKQSEEITENKSKKVNIPIANKLVFTDKNNKKYSLNLPAFNDETLYLSLSCDESKGSFNIDDCQLTANFIVEYKGQMLDEFPYYKMPADLKIPGGNPANPRTSMRNDGSGEKLYFVGNDLKIEEVK